MRHLSGLAILLSLSLAACGSTPDPEDVDAAASEEAAVPQETAEADVAPEPEKPKAYLQREGVLTWGEGGPASPAIHIVRNAGEFSALERSAGVDLGEPPEGGQHYTIVFLGTQPHPIKSIFIKRNAVRGDTRTLVLRETPFGEDDDEDEVVSAKTPWAVIPHRGTPVRNTEVDFQAYYDATFQVLPERALRTNTTPYTAVSGTYGPVKAATRIARTPEDWASIWRAVGIEPEGELAEGQLAVAIFLGERPSGGHELQIKGVDEIEGVVHIVAQETAPGPDEAVTQELTYPWAIVRVDIPTTVDPAISVLPPTGVF